MIVSIRQVFKLASLFFVVLLPSCTQEIEEQLTHSLTEVATVTLALDAETHYAPAKVETFVTEDDELLYFSNVNTNGINIYSLTQRKQLHKFSLPKDGPYAIPVLQGFSVAAADSILVMPRGAFDLSYWVDSTGRFLGKLAESFPEEIENKLFNHISNSTVPTFLTEDGVYLVEWPLDIETAQPIISENYDGYPDAFRYDLATSQLEQLSVHWPSSYNDQYWSVSSLLFSYYKTEDGLFAISWAMSDSLVVTDFKGKSTTYWAGSHRYLSSKPPKAYAKELEGEEAAQASVEHYRYDQVLYDPYRKVYYRTAHLPIEFDPEVHPPDYRAQYYQPILVIVLNENFKKIGEQLLREGIFNPFYCFVAKEGLFVPQLHPQHPDLQEDSVTFSVFEPKKIKIN